MCGVFLWKFIRAFSNDLSESLYYNYEKSAKKAGVVCINSDFDNLNGIYDEIKNAFGIEVTLQFYSMFKGQQITFPMYLFDKKYIAAKIRDEYDGKNSKELAKKYGYSERRIREIAKK